MPDFSSSGNETRRGGACEHYCTEHGTLGYHHPMKLKDGELVRLDTSSLCVLRWIYVRL